MIFSSSLFITSFRTKTSNGHMFNETILPLKKDLSWINSSESVEVR